MKKYNYPDESRTRATKSHGPQQHPHKINENFHAIRFIEKTGVARTKKYTQDIRIRIAGIINAPRDQKKIRITIT